MKRMAYLILAHRSPEILKKLVYALDDPRFDVFVHIDKKKDISKFGLEQYKLHDSQLFILPERVNVGWGDISMVDAMVKLHHYALNQGDYERFIMLSGEDYPVQSNDVIYETLTKENVEFIRAPKARHLRRHTDYWIGRRYSRCFCAVGRRLLRYIGISKKPYFYVNNEKWEICRASQWYALSKGCVQHVLSIYDQNPCIRAYFKYSFAPDETVIPTILMNTPEYRENIFLPIDIENNSFNLRPVLHYVMWKRNGRSSVEVFDEAAYDRIVSSGKLFVRKVRIGISDRLIDMLDERRAKQKTDDVIGYLE